MKSRTELQHTATSTSTQIREQTVGPLQHMPDLPVLRSHTNKGGLAQTLDSKQIEPQFNIIDISFIIFGTN